MKKRAGQVLNLATPLKAWLQRFTLFLLVGTTLILMLVGRNDSVVVERARTHVADAIEPILSFMAQPVDSVNQAIQNARELATLRELNNDLLRENERLTALRAKALQLEGENQALRSLLNLVPEARQHFVTTRVIADQGGAFVRSVLIDSGGVDGVAKGQAAMDGKGLIGRVAEVGSKVSRVLLITDINSRIPVKVGSNGDHAILAGDNSARPLLDHLGPGATIAPGDAVITSGRGGLLPAGLPVGIVVADSSGVLKVRPAADWQHMTYLRVVDYAMADTVREFLDSTKAARK